MIHEITDDEEGINFKVILCMGFAIFLQYGELTWNT